MKIENFEISGNFRQSFAHFLTNVAAFGWIVLQGGMIFLIQDFLCFEVYTSTLWKKLFGDQCDDKYFCKWIWLFFVTKISEDRFHLPGEREREFTHYGLSKSVSLTLKQHPERFVLDWFSAERETISSSKRRTMCSEILNIGRKEGLCILGFWILTEKKDYLAMLFLNGTKTDETLYLFWHGSPQDESALTFEILNRFW